jgi:hypothetical protein
MAGEEADLSHYCRFWVQRRFEDMATRRQAQARRHT